jgi:hypothetical protein
MKKMIIASAMIAFASSEACAAQITNYTNDEGNVVVTVSGEITYGDSDAVVQSIKTANNHGRRVSALRLNSGGGRVVEGLKLAKVVREAHLATVVTRGSMCASACFIPFIASHEKWKSTNAGVGVHGASNEYGQETDGSQVLTILMARLVKAFGASDSIVGKMVTTPPSNMVWLSDNDLEQVGVRITGRANYQTSRLSNPQEEDPLDEIDKFFDELFE